MCAVLGVYPLQRIFTPIFFFIVCSDADLLLQYSSLLAHNTLTDCDDADTWGHEVQRLSSRLLYSLLFHEYCNSPLTKRVGRCTIGIFTTIRTVYTHCYASAHLLHHLVCSFRSFFPS
jgi:hypothetical protein